MSHSDRMPIFNLKAVVHETGIKPDTLRAWERRYGIPEPQRTESGHRLYTERDISILKWLLQRQDEGLSISRAVTLWRKLENELGDPLRDPTDSSSAGALSTVPASSTLPGMDLWRDRHVANSANHAYGDIQPDSGARIEALRDQWVNAALAYDEQAADAVLATAFGLFAPETVCIELIQKALAAIGDGWYEGRVTVQQEHFASALAMRKLESLLAATPPPTRAGRILVGCPPEESHTFVPLMLSLLLRRKGWNVIYLGADIPVQSLEVTVNTTRPDLVVLTAQQLHTVAGLMEMAKVLSENQIALGYGGLIFNRFPSLHRILPGYFLGNQLHNAVQAVDQIMFAPRPKVADDSVGRAYLVALEEFQAKRPLIEAEVWKQLEQSEMPQRHLNAGNTNFARSIQAALTLGDMDFLGPDMDWIQGLLHNHYRMPRFMVREYLNAYRYAVERQLGAGGNVILAWLDKILSHENHLSMNSGSGGQLRAAEHKNPEPGSADDPNAYRYRDSTNNNANVSNSNSPKGSHAPDNSWQSPSAFKSIQGHYGTSHQRN